MSHGTAALTVYGRRIVVPRFLAGDPTSGQVIRSSKRSAVAVRGPL